MSATISLRPMLPKDGPLLAAIFEASILELTGEDYSEAQQQAWAAAAEDDEAFAARLAKQTTLLAILGGNTVGFASLKGTEQIDMLFVHPDATEQGVATTLIDALEKLAGARGGKKLTADVSDNAGEFFQKRGYRATQRNSVPLNGEWLSNTTMEKSLVPAALRPKVN